MVKVSVKKGDITQERVDAVVNAANSYGSMGGGVAWAIKHAGGREIEAEAIRLGPTPVGRAVATKAGRLPAKYVIHAPTMTRPAERIGPGNVGKATYAALVCAKKLGVNSIAFPGMGTGVGGVGKKEAAFEMVSAIKRFIKEWAGLPEIILVGFDDDLVIAFSECVKDEGL